MASNTTFLFRKDWLDALDELSAESRLKVIGAVCEYAFLPEDERHDFCPLDDAAERVAYRFICRCVDTDQNNYQKQVVFGKKGGAPRGNQNARKRKTTTPSATSAETPDNEHDENNPKQPQNNSKTTETTKTTLYHYHNHYHNHYHDHYSFSSCADVFDHGSSEEEEQQQEICEYLFLERNAFNAYSQAKELISYNQLPGHVPLSEQTPEERRACMDRWKVKDGRFPTKVLQAWSDVFAILVSLEAPYSVRHAATDDALNFRSDSGSFRIRCPKLLYMALELFIEELRPALKNLSGAKPINYELTDEDNDRQNIIDTLAQLRREKREIELSRSTENGND